MKNVKDRVIDGLTAAYAADAISVEEYERRVGLVASSRDGAEAESALADLPTEFRSLPQERPETERVPAPRKRHGEILAIFASVERGGRWTPSPILEASVVFGSAFVDFREADLPREGVRLEANAVFGSLVVVVPEDVNVHVRSNAVFGSSSGGVDRYVGDSAPTLDIEANAIFGNCEVKVARRGERIAGAPPGSIEGPGGR